MPVAATSGQSSGRSGYPPEPARRCGPGDRLPPAPGRVTTLADILPTPVAGLLAKLRIGYPEAGLPPD